MKKDIDKTSRNNKKIIIYSSRFGGPYNQYKLLKKKLEEKNYKVRLYNTYLKSAFSLFFEKKDVLITLIPLPFRFRAKKYIQNIKGQFYQEKHFIRNPFAYLYPRGMKIADVVVVPSKFLKEDLINKNSKWKLKQAIIIPNGVKLEEKAELKNKKDIRIITATNFSFPIKSRGVLKLVKAISEVSPKKIDKLDKKIVFEIFGEGHFLEEIKEQSKELIKQKNNNINIKFKGFSKNLKKEFLNTDLFLYWSKHDNMPNSVIEAMSYGLPIICNDVGAIKEIIKTSKEGIISTEKNLVNNIEKLILNYSKRKELGKNARKSIEQNLNIDIIIKKWIKLIED